jgi:hypothetical protein
MRARRRLGEPPLRGLKLEPADANEGQATFSYELQPPAAPAT